MDGAARWRVVAVAIFACCVPDSAVAVVVDALIDEEEWRQAHVYTDFRTTQPLLLTTPAHETRARVLPTPEGLAVAIECVEPQQIRVRGRSSRDALVMDADAVSILVDFDGSGSTGYEFTVSLSGSVRDGIVLQQNRPQYTWDAIWYSAVRETDTGWQLEVLLPWSTAGLGNVVDGHRTIGLMVSRELRSQGLRFAYPAVPVQSPSFVADFHKLSIPDFDSALLSFVPYGAVSRDLIAGHTALRAGADLMWKPTAQQQLTVSLMPDFGQVESDDLVVNFSAVEIFVPDKRPFFTQNQELFDVRTSLRDTLIHTRRIGAAPDAGPRRSSEVLAAAKYLWADSNWQLGGFAAAEDDTAFARGRTFAALRGRWARDGLSVGYLGTYVERPTLTRQAVVHAGDLDWSPASGWRVSTQLITTQISRQVGDDREVEPGYGALARLEYAGHAPLTHALYLTWYDDAYDSDDLGFLERNSLREMSSYTSWYYRREYPASSPLLETRWLVSTSLRFNEHDDFMPSWLQIGPFWKYRDGSSLMVYLRPTSSGLDDRSTRGAGAFVLPPQPEAHASFLSSPSYAFQYYFHLKLFREGLERYGWEGKFEPSWWLAEDLKLNASVTYRRSPDWLIWRADAERMARHRRGSLQTAVSAAWLPSTKLELRAKVQWTALHARTIEAFDIEDQRLVRSDVLPADFSRSELAMQLRLRYELRPLSDLYVVYSSGGFADASEATGFGDLWEAARRGRTAQQLMIKLTYRL